MGCLELGYLRDFVLRVYSGKVIRCEAVVNVMAKLFGSEVGCFKSDDVVYGLV
jgi:hypothetical protein